MVSAASEGLGAKAMALDFGGQLGVDIHVDASAASGVAQRKGLGKIRQVDAQSLWIQDAVHQRRVQLQKIKGAQNPADMLTKYLDSGGIATMMAKLCLILEAGRPSLPPPQVAEDDEEPIDHQFGEGNGMEINNLEVMEEGGRGSEGPFSTLGISRLEFEKGYRDEKCDSAVMVLRLTPQVHVCVEGNLGCGSDGLDWSGLGVGCTCNGDMDVGFWISIMVRVVMLFVKPRAIVQFRVRR